MEIASLRSRDGASWPFVEEETDFLSKLLEVERRDDGTVAFRTLGPDRHYVRADLTAGEGDAAWFKVEKNEHGLEMVGAYFVQDETATIEALKKQKGCCGAEDEHGHDHGNLEWNAEQHNWVLEGALQLILPFANTEETDIGRAATRIVRLFENSAFRETVFAALLACDYRPEYTGILSYVMPVQIYYKHFYDPATNRNFMTMRGYEENARTECERRFFNAVSKRPEGMTQYDESSSAWELGLALHYLTDLTQPMHAANFPNYLATGSLQTGDSRHSNFEGRADQPQFRTQCPPVTEEFLRDAVFRRNVTDFVFNVANKAKDVWSSGLGQIATGKARWVEASWSNWIPHWEFREFGPEVDDYIRRATQQGQAETAAFLLHYAVHAAR
ncbi:MAG TPA: hypothetical protein VEK11_04720 [Thermoanaerobaculia bacterium]|nr:hypothetical protein [Thermoanaerobaculia bacterium]